jgi:hypothetical protein
MPTTYSANLGIELIGTGEQSGTWGVTTNSNLGTLLEQSIAGYVTQAVTDGSPTVLTIPNGATGVARNMYLELTGALTAARVVEVPTNKKLYFIFNNTTGAFTITFANAGGGTTFAIPQGEKRIIYSDGTNIRESVTLPTVPAAFASGTAMLFVQTSAPTGWTKSTTHDNKALRIVSGAASTGGSVAFTTAFTSQAVAGTVGSTVLTTSQIPSHSHTTLSDVANCDGGGLGVITSISGTSGSRSGVTAVEGGGLGHTHTFTGTAINLAVSYVDVIIATKD